MTMPAVADVAPTYQPRMPLRDYQAREYGRMDGRRAWALLMAMRTGKTAVALADFGRAELRGEVDDLLVVAPAGVYLTWVGEVDKHLSDDLRRRVRIGVWKSGLSDKKLEELRAFMRDTSTPRIFLCNVEALSRVGTVAVPNKARAACRFFLEQRGNRATMVVDESTVIKNPKALRTRFVLDVLAPRAAYRRILSGLPTPRSPLDIWAQFAFLDTRILGHDIYRSFMHEYAIVQRKLFPGARYYTDVVVGYRNVERLQELIAPHASRVEFRPNIPPTWSHREVAFTTEQRRVYNDLVKYATAKLDEETHVTAPIVITQLLRLHQVLCGHVVDENGVERDIPENKTAELLELLDDYSGKAVIWCTYDADVRKVSRALAREFGPRDEFDRPIEPTFPNATVARFWGGNLNTREAEEARFKTDPACRYMVATASAGGRGRTWDVADLVVYYSSSFDLEHREQSEQRVQATDKLRGVDYVDLVAPNTVETKILNALRNKMDLASVITGDTWREWVV